RGDKENDSVLRQSTTRVLVFLDPPSHTALRDLIAKNLADQDDFADLAERRLLTLDGHDGDFVRDFVVPVLAISMCRRLGLDEADWPRLVEWSRRCSDLFDPLATAPTIQAGAFAGFRF